MMGKGARLRSSRKRDKLMCKRWELRMMFLTRLKTREAKSAKA